MNAFTIKDLENLSGIKAHTIRIWEQRYSLFKPQRTDTNIRYYSNNELKMVLNIALLNKYGYKISHIDKMSEEVLKEKINTLVHHEAQQERLVNQLISSLVDLELDEFENQLNQYIAQRGIEKAINNIIFPFLERVGILWLTNHINPAQEHLVSNIIRQKLIVGIDSANPVLSNPKKVLMFLPEGEHHELGLLFVQYLLKSRGVKVFYVGANIPLKDLDYVINIKKPDLLYSHLTSVAHNFNFEKFLLKVKERLPHSKLLISGVLTHNYKKEIPSNVIFKKSLPDVLDFIIHSN
ncbi:MAG: MerR family transcriptional regulator [Chitinophagaceae bacterium]